MNTIFWRSISSIKAFISSTPQLYDFCLRYWPSSAESDRFFRAFSRFCNRRVQFIQVGASDGLRWDPIRKYIIRDHWRGVFVEPLPVAFEMLKKNYSYLHARDFVFVNAAVGGIGCNNLTFWTFSEHFLASLTTEQRMYFLRKSSFNRSHVVRAITSYTDGEKRYLGIENAENISRLNPDDVLIGITVPCMTLNDIVTLHWRGGNIDLLIIDAEGHEAEILLNIDFERMRPTGIFFESHNLGPNKQVITNTLKNYGYTVKELGGDSVALSQSKTECLMW